MCISFVTSGDTKDILVTSNWSAGKEEAKLSVTVSDNVQKSRLVKSTQIQLHVQSFFIYFYFLLRIMLTCYKAHETISQQTKELEFIFLADYNR